MSDRTQLILPIPPPPADSMTPLVPARMVNEWVYCPRLAYLEWVEGEWAESADTAEGRRVHARVDKGGGRLPDPDELDEEMARARSVTLSSERLGVIAKMDVVEVADGIVMPVDFKKGKRPHVPAGAYEPERVQVCVQAMILEDTGARSADWRARRMRWRGSSASPAGHCMPRTSSICLASRARLRRSTSASSTTCSRPARQDGLGAFSFTTRNRRPPTDPINAMLSLAYALLVRVFSNTISSTGLDPYLGLYHRPRHNRPALALDLMEPFRSIVADSSVIQVVNNGEVRPNHFVFNGPACSLKPAGRKALMAAFERRLEQETTHPLFGYRVSMRRLIEVQARLLARHFQGEIVEYPHYLPR